MTSNAKGAKRLSEIVLPVYQGEFWQTRKTYVLCKGSRGSGKSKAAALWHIVHMMQLPLSNTLVVRKVERTLRDSCFSDLQWAIRQLGVEKFWSCTVSPLEMSYKPTGQKILFRGLDDGYKITSISVPRGVLNFLWLEEFYEISREEDFDLLDESIRGRLPDGYFKRITATFNPWSERHFAKKRFFDSPADNVLAMTTTWQDNPYLSEADRALFEAMKLHNPRRYRVAGLGEWGVAEGLVYENWAEEAFDLDLLRKKPGVQAVFGLDFGYTNDPTALFCGLVSKGERKLWVFDELYEKGLVNREIAERITAMGYAKEKIFADAAEPKSIAELREAGLSRIRAAQKGRDSVSSGIQFIQGYQIIVHPRCTNFLTEISSYGWEKDRFGALTNRPANEGNHLMDAMRYGMGEVMRGSNFSFA